eukprot:11443194-Karenia_brevis.AAC.1
MMRRSKVYEQDINKIQGPAVQVLAGVLRLLEDSRLLVQVWGLALGAVGSATDLLQLVPHTFDFGTPGRMKEESDATVQLILV